MHDSFNILKVKAAVYLIGHFPKVSRFVGIIYYIVVRIRALQVDCLDDRSVGIQRGTWSEWSLPGR